MLGKYCTSEVEKMGSKSGLRFQSLRHYILQILPQVTSVISLSKADTQCLRMFFLTLGAKTKDHKFELSLSNLVTWQDPILNK